MVCPDFEEKHAALGLWPVRGEGSQGLGDIALGRQSPLIRDKQPGRRPQALRGQRSVLRSQKASPEVAASRATSRSHTVVVPSSACGSFD